MVHWFYMPIIMFINRNCLHKIYTTVSALFLGVCLAYGDPAPTRFLTLTYTCYLTNLPSTAKQVDCWIPVPISNDRQTVEILTADLTSGRFTKEPRYGNKMYYRRFILNFTRPTDTLTITLSYKIKLDEKSVPEAKELSPLPEALQTTACRFT